MVTAGPSTLSAKNVRTSQVARGGSGAGRSSSIAAETPTSAANPQNQPTAGRGP